ncbi:MAG TPA: signal peptidase I [Bdellovibrionales bacterium]|nr:signal peptidase I [Bdellovibrionales bacterium]
MSSPRLRSFIREYVETLLAALLIAVLVRIFVLTAFKIPTSSMLPTLHVGDFVFAYKLPYGLHLPFATQKVLQTAKPQRGEVVVFRYPGDDNLNFIKRVIAVEGDKIEIRNRRLYVNDVPSTYERVEGETPQVPGQDYYSVLRENAAESTRLVMFKKGASGGDFGPELVPPGHIFVLGDNRDSTDDSRYWGMIPADRVDGRIVAIWLSLDWESRWGGGSFPRVRWERVLARVD